MPFLTPGAAASSSLEQILATKKAEARQALLDSLNQKNVESEVRSRDENAKSSALYRQMQGSLYNTQEEQRKVGMIDSTPMGIGTDVTGRFAPDVESVGKQYGRLRNQEIINDEGTDTNPHTFSLGTPKEKENANIDKAIDDMTPSFMDAFGAENQGPIAALIKAHKATHTIPTSAELAPYIKSTQRQDAFVWGRDGKLHKGDSNGPVVTDTPVGAQIHSMPAPTQGRAPIPFSHKDANGQTVWSWVNPGDPIPTDYVRGNQPTGDNTFHPVIDPVRSQNIAKLYAAATTSDTDKDWNAFYAAANAGVAGSRADDSIKAVIAKIIADAQAGNPDPRTTQQIIDASTKNATPQEKKDFSDLLRTIRSEGLETQ